LHEQLGSSTPEFSGMPADVTVHSKGKGTVVVKTTLREKSGVTIMMAVSAHGTKPPLYATLKKKTPE